MPNNDRVYQKYADQGVVLLGVTADDTRAAYDGWVQRNATKYKFKMAFDPAGKEVWKGNVKPAMAKPAVKLAPATVYTWTVMTPKGARAEGRFETVSAEGIAKAEKSRAGARSFSDRVVHAVVLQDLGAAQDAKQAWAALAAERPDLSELAALAR